MRSAQLVQSGLVAMAVVLMPVFAAAQDVAPTPVELSSGWQMQDVAKVPEAGAAVSSEKYAATGWYAATVPGTVLTTLVNNHVYPEPLYGENNRPEIIPESLNKSSYWYRIVVDVPKEYKHKQVWLNFDGINYSSVVWVNGQQVGTTRGAFIRGVFDISKVVKAGKKAVVAVLVTPEPHPGVPHEHTIRDGVGKNGGITALDGATFLSTIGWDWLAAVRDRDTGIWQKAFLSATGPVVVKEPLVTTDLPLPKTDSADVGVSAKVENVTDKKQKGVLKGTIESITFEREVELAPHSSQVVSFTAKDTPGLHMVNPRLWWPNGYGPQNLYKLHLSFEVKKEASDTADVTFGVRKITYEVPDSDNLTISVNGVRVFIRGGDWGLDEAMKRIPRERLEAQIRMHQLANLNMIRNWVGQSTSEDFYELCDKYGILLWDEFFQPNPSDGPNPEDVPTYIANVKDKILRFRNHPSIAVWCARNEGYPPKEIDDELRNLMAELEPTRLYQPSSTAGRGVISHGPYHWRTPREFYKMDAAFKTETGSMSVPTIESIHGMMPEKDWETINDDWAQHDFAKGAQQGDKYPGIVTSRYGKIANLADFVRKAQMMNYEAYRAMYEGRNAEMFHLTTGVLTWMSHPAQPSFVWQLYHYDLEPNASLFAVKEASEMEHIQFNQATGELEVINNRPDALTDATARLRIFNLDGSVAYEHEYKVTAAADKATSLGAVEFPATVSQVHFLKLELMDATGKELSDNFYWRATPGPGGDVQAQGTKSQEASPEGAQAQGAASEAVKPEVAKAEATDPQDDYTAMETMPKVVLGAEVSRADANGKTVVTVTLHNTTAHVAVMAHVQLRRKSGERVLPVFYSDNYISLVPGESRTITMEAAESDLKGEDALVVLDGWNVSVSEASAAGVAIAPNVDAEVEHWPVTGLPFQTVGLR
jgi:beta-galactosidase/beta-glucuronidase